MPFLFFCNVEELPGKTGCTASTGASCVTQNPEWAPFGALFRSEWAPLVGLGVRKFDARAKFRALCLVWAPHLGGKKTLSVSLQKTYVTPSGSTKNACHLRHCFTKMCFLPKENDSSQKCVFFRNFEPPHFCNVFSNICGTVVRKNNEARGPVFNVFGTPWPILRLTGPEIFGTGMCDGTAGF